MLAGLKPFTQYAFYVKTMTISTERRNGQSVIHYFKTKSHQPTNVNNLQAYAETNSMIVMNWSPPSVANGKLIKYMVRAQLFTKNHQLESRNYCKDRKFFTLFPFSPFTLVNPFLNNNNYGILVFEFEF